MLVMRLEVAEEVLVHEAERPCHHVLALLLDRDGMVDHRVVLTLGTANLLEELLAHLDTVLAVTMLDDVD